MGATTRVAVLVGLLGSTRIARADQGERWDRATVGIQAVSGVVGATVVAMPTFYLASRSCRGLDCLGAVVPTMVGGVVGTIGGVYGAGRILDGTGSLIGTTLGTAAGVAGAFAVGALVSAVDPKHDIWYLTTLLPIFAGAIVGYHGSAEADPSASARTGARTLAFSLAF